MEYIILNLFQNLLCLSIFLSLYLKGFLGIFHLYLWLCQNFVYDDYLKKIVKIIQNFAGLEINKKILNIELNLLTKCAKNLEYNHENYNIEKDF